MPPEEAVGTPYPGVCSTIWLHDTGGTSWEAPTGGVPSGVVVGGTCTGSPGYSSSGKILLLLTLLTAGVGPQLGGPYHGPDWIWRGEAWQRHHISHHTCGSTCRPATTSWTKVPQPDKLSSERYVEKPPCGGTLSGGGGIARREQALRVWICAGLRVLSSRKGA